MPFTQETPINKSVCDGCGEHCKLGGLDYLHMNYEDIFKFCRECGTYYWPTIGGKIIRSYKAADGTTVGTRLRAKTQVEATQLAREISKLCANYKTKQNNQR